MHIKIDKGLDIPIKGKPQGGIKGFVSTSSLSSHAQQHASLNLKSFEEIKFKLLAKVGDTVKIGQPIAEDKSSPGRMFCSPASGIIKEVRRGYKRSLTDIVIEVSKSEEYYEFSSNLSQNSREQLVSRLMEGGAFTRIRNRPFNLLADPAKTPRSIFVKALESAPFATPAELQVEGHEDLFQAGLNALAKLTSGNVNLVHRKGTTCKAFTGASNVQVHSAEGPHPIANYSLHIQNIDPIKSIEDVVWTLNVHDVIAIGSLLLKKRYFNDCVISIAGPGILPDQIGFYRCKEGISIESLISDRLINGEAIRLISGDPLMGNKVSNDDFLGFDHYTFCAIPEGTYREFLHFFGLGIDKYSFSKTYVSGHLDNSERKYDFTTSQHGEHRAFIDSSLYDLVMPISVPTMPLVKAVMAEDFELAEKLGLLSVDSEDFALPTFVCPSKMEMTEIIKSGLKRYASEVLT